MQDLFVNFVGALTFSVIGYFSVKSGNNKIAKQFVPVVLPEEPKAESGRRSRTGAKAGSNRIKNKE